MIDVGGRDGLGDVRDPEAGILDQRPALARRGQPDDDVDPRLVEVQGMGVALAAVADDRDRLPARAAGSASLS